MTVVIVAKERVMVNYEAHIQFRRPILKAVTISDSLANMKIVRLGRNMSYD